MSQSKKITRLNCALMLACAAVPIPLTAMGSTMYTWVGGAATNDWSQPGNWLNHVPPASDATNTDIVFPPSSFPFPNEDNPISIHSITFDGNDAYVQGGAGPISLGNGGITDNSAANQVVTNTLFFLASQTWTLSPAAGTLDVVSAVPGNFGLAINAQGVNTLEGNVPVSTTFLKTGAGTLTLSGSFGSLDSTTAEAASGVLTVGPGATFSAATLSIAPGASVGIAGGTLSGTAVNVCDSTSTTAAMLNISAGLLGGNTLTVGDAINAAGIVSQTGGTNNMNVDLLGFANTASTGTYLLSNGTLSAGFINIGGLGTGTFIQSGGQNTVNTLNLNNGLYRLSGGTFQPRNVATGASNGVFEFNGGTLQATDNGLEISGLSACTVQSGGAVIDTNGFTVDISQALLHDPGAPAIDGGLLKKGSGTLDLNANDTLTGNTAINAGTLNLASSGALQFSTVSLATSGGTLTFDSAVTAKAFTIGGLSGTGNLSLQNNASIPAAINLSVGNNNTNTTFSGKLNGSGGLTKIGAATLSLTGSNGYTGPTTVTGGALTLGNGGSLINSLVNVGPGATLNISGGNINAGSATFLEEANSTSTTAAHIILTTGSVVDGETDVANAAGSTASFVQTGGSHTISGNLYLGVASGSNGSYTLSGNSTLTAVDIVPGFSGAGTFVQNGGHATAGNVLLSDNSGLGTYDLNGGTLSVNAINGVFGNSYLNLNGGILQATAGGSSLIGEGINVQVQAGGAIMDSNGNNTIVVPSLNHDATPGAPPIDGGLTKNGSGVVVLFDSDTFTGNTTINAGGIQLADPNSLTNSTVALSSTGGTLIFDVISPAGFTLGGLSGNGNLPLLDDGQNPLTLSVGNNNASTTYSAILSGSGSLVKIGAGTLTLTGSNTYSGPTTVTGGTLAVGPGGSLFNSLISVGPGAAFNLNGGTIDTSTASFVQVGNSPSTTLAQFNLTSGALTDGELDLANAANSTASFVQTGGSHTVNGILELAVGSASSATYTLSGNGALTTQYLIPGGAGVGTFIQNGGHVSATNVLIFGEKTTGQSTYDLNGGTLRAASIVDFGQNGILNLNGGTLQSTGANPLISSVGHIYVQAGGAVIDSNGFTTMETQPLVHDPASNAPPIDGGLTKIGLGTLVLQSTNTYTGLTTVMVGNLTIASAPALPGGPISISPGASAATMTLTPGLGQLTASGLTLGPTGTLDIGNNKLRINYGSPAADPAAALVSELTSGFDGGEWEGVGINSTSAALAPSKFAVGYLDGNTATDRTAGTVAPNQFIVKYTLAGDAFLENTVGFDDLVVVAQNFGFTGEDWAGGNFVYDPTGSIGFADLVKVAQNFGFSSGVSQGTNGANLSPAWQGAAATTSVPEPATFTAAVALAATLIPRRKTPGRKRNTANG